MSRPELIIFRMLECRGLGGDLRKRLATFGASAKSRVVMAGFGLLMIGAVLHAQSVFNGDFESGGLGSYSVDWEGPDSHMSVSVVSSPHPVADGSHSARFTVDLPDTTFPIMRNEIRAGDWVATPGIGMMGQEYTYTFSHFIPASWPNTVLPIEVAQFHVHPDMDAGENWRAPVLALLIRNHRWELVNRWDDSVVTTAASTRTVDLGNPSLELGVWTHWRINVLWSWGDPNAPQGFLKIWKNGELIVDRVGPNCYNDVYPRTFKWGIYTRSIWAQHEFFPVAHYELYADGFRAELQSGSGSSSGTRPGAPTGLRLVYY